MLRKIFVSLLMVGLLFALVAATAMNDRLIGIDLPKLTGSYSVGRADYDLTDPFRKEIFGSDPNANREIMVSVYYPAQPPAKSKPAPYLSGKMADILAAKIHLPAFAFQLVHSHAYDNVPVASGNFPVVLFSPGIGTSPSEYTGTVEDLASHGYVVAVIYHTYCVPVTIFSDGRAAMINDAGIRFELQPDGTSDRLINQYRDQIGSVWVADARFTLDQLTLLNASDPLLKGHLNLDEVGMYGHSFGGATTAQVLSIDKRFKAGINMDGTVFTMTDGSQITQPFMWMASDYSNVSDSQLKQVNMTRSEFNMKLKLKNDQRDAFINTLGSSVLFVLKGSTHSTYITDDALVSPFLPGMNDPLATIEGKRAVTVINAYASAFFDQNLKQKDTNLLKGDSTNFPEVSLRIIRK